MDPWVAAAYELVCDTYDTRPGHMSAPGFSPRTIGDGLTVLGFTVALDGSHLVTGLTGTPALQDVANFLETSLSTPTSTIVDLQGYLSSGNPNTAITDVETYASQNGFYVVRPNDTLASIAAANAATSYSTTLTAGILHDIASSYGNNGTTAGHLLYVPAGNGSNGQTLTGLKQTLAAIPPSADGTGGNTFFLDEPSGRLFLVPRLTGDGTASGDLVVFTGSTHFDAGSQATVSDQGGKITVTDAAGQSNTITTTLLDTTTGTGWSIESVPGSSGTASGTQYAGPNGTGSIEATMVADAQGTTTYTTVDINGFIGGSDLGSNIFNPGPTGVGDETYQGGTFTPDVTGSSWDTDSNQYGFNPGSGNLTIVPGNSTNDGSIDLAGIGSGDLTFQADDATGDLTITDGTAGDKITVAGEFSTTYAAGNAVRRASYGGYGRSMATPEDRVRLIGDPSTWRSGGAMIIGSPPKTGSRIVADGSGTATQHQAIGSIVTADGTINTYDLTFTWTGDAIGSNYGNNSFTLNGGNATVSGGQDANTYAVAAGTGTTTIASNGTGSLALGFASTDPITYVTDGQGDLTMTDGASGQAIDISGEYLGAGQSTTPTIRYATFSDGASIDLSQVGFTVAVASGGTVTGTGFGTDTFILATGNGTAIAGTEGGDTFIDAPGAHAVTGGAGQNTYDFAGGNGTLTIIPGAGGNTLQVGAGINEADVTYNADKATGNLTLTDGATGDTVVMLADLGGGANAATSKIQFIGFDNGDDVFVPTGIVSTNPVAPGTTYSGSNLVNNLFVLPATGAVVNAGGQFNDYVESTASSGATINLAGTGRLDLGTGSTEENTWLAKSGNNLLVEKLGSSTVLTVENWFNLKNDLGTITSADGSQIAATQIAGLASSMGSYATAHGFNPATASVMPTLASLQNAVHADWR